MSGQFEKGQLVAVRDAADGAWALRIYDHASPEGQHFCRGLEKSTPPCWWCQVEPAEDVWPDVFLAGDREALVELRTADAIQEHQIAWLCKRIEAEGDTRGEQEGPPDGCFRDCRLGCVKCWERSSYEVALEELGHDA